MADLDGGVLATQAAGHVQQAAKIAGDEEISAGGGDVGGFVRHHAGRDVWIFDAERAAEAAAEFGLRHFREAQAGDGGEQGAGLGFDTKLAQAGAGVVVGGVGGKWRRGGGEVHDVGEKGGELVGFGGECIGLGAEIRIVIEQAGEVFGDHAGAGAGGGHDVIVSRKGDDQAAGKVAGGFTIAGIKGGLAAARLRAGDFDETAGGFQERYGGEADAGPVQIDQAGDEEADAGRCHGQVLTTLRPGGEAG